MGYPIHIAMNNHAIYFYLMTDDSCILFYRVSYCTSYRTENKLFYFYFIYFLCEHSFSHEKACADYLMKAAEKSCWDLAITIKIFGLENTRKTAKL
jgi:hypothetical protein